MTQGIVTQDRRAVRAAGIVERAECELQDNGTWRVRDTQTGSGRWHTVFAGRCTCFDYLRGAVCKHLRAVRAEEAALAHYREVWDSRSEQARHDRDNVTISPRQRIAQPSGQRCPDCGAELKSAQFYTGGRGYRMLLICTRDQAHRALPA